MNEKIKLQQIKVINIFDEDTEAICNYLTCYHDFSLHNIDAHIRNVSIHRISQ
jgi:hypothetical protein